MQVIESFSLSDYGIEGGEITLTLFNRKDLKSYMTALSRLLSESNKQDIDVASEATDLMYETVKSAFVGGKYTEDGKEMPMSTDDVDQLSIASVKYLTSALKGDVVKKT